MYIGLVIHALFVVAVVVVVCFVLMVMHHCTLAQKGSIFCQ